MAIQKSKYTIEVFKYLVSAMILGSAIGVMVLLIKSKQPPPNNPSAVFVPSVRLFEAAQYNGNIDLIVSGTVAPYREINVAAEVTGQIKTKTEVCQSGTYVEKDTILFEIDRKDLDVDLKRIAAEVSQAEKMLAETVEDLRAAEETLALARQEFEIERSQFQRRQEIRNAISKAEFDQAQKTYLTAQTQLNSRINAVRALETRKARMNSAIDVAKAQRDRIELDLKRTIVRAPTAGVIVSESVEEGEIVNRGTVLILFEDTSKSEVKCSLTQSELSWVRENSPGNSELSLDNMKSIYHLPKTRVTIYDQANPTVKWQGILQRFDGIGLDTKTKTIPCRIEIINPITQDENERPVAIVREMFVKCKIEIPIDEMAGNGKQFVFCPASAVQPGDYVWKVRKEDYVVDANDQRLKEQLGKSKGLLTQSALLAWRPPKHRYYLVKQDVKIVDYTSPGEFDRKMIIVQVDKGGLNIQDHVVATPITQPSDGAEVKIFGTSDSKNSNQSGTVHSTPAKADANLTASDQSSSTTESTSKSESETN